MRFCQYLSHAARAIVILFGCLTSGSLKADLSDLNLTTAFFCNFQMDVDQNADRQPDGWRRRKDRQHPNYVNAEILPRDPEMARQGREAQMFLAKLHHAWKTKRWEPDFTPETMPDFLEKLMDQSVLNQCYQVRIEDGAFELRSPKFPLDSRFSYRLQADLSSQSLAGREASVELHVYTSANKEPLVFQTASITDTQDWTTVTSQRVDLPEGSVAVGELVIKTSQGGYAPGIARFDNLNVLQLPRIHLSSDAQHGLTQPGLNVTLQLKAIGIPDSIQAVLFQILDIDSHVVQEQLVHLERQPTEPGSYPSSTPSASRPYLVHSRSDKARGEKQSQNQSAREFESSRSIAQRTSCSAQWQFAPTKVGFYRVRASLSEQCIRSFNLAVLDTVETKSSPFGWSLSTEKSFKSETLPALLGQASIGWVKLPIWIDHSDVQTISEINQLMSRLKKQGIQCVGVFSQPPPSVSEILTDRVNPSNAASLFSDSQVWLESIEPLLLQVNFGLEWMQLGNESDMSFVNETYYTKQVATRLRQIQSLGQDIKLVVGWDWLESTRAATEATGPASDETPWSALHYSASPSLTPTDLLTYAKSRQNVQVQAWTSIQPLSKDSHSLQIRTQNLAQQMIAIGQARVQAAFATPIADDEHGLFDQSANCSELLVPWVLLSRAIGSKQYLGALDLPNQSYNHLFEQGDQGVMIVWSQQPVIEEVYLGVQPKAMDVWGRDVPFETIQLPSGSQIQRIPVGPWPLIIDGVEPEIVRLKREFELLTTQLASEVLDRGRLQVRMPNPFSGDLSGRIEVHSPSMIKNQMASLDVRLPAAHAETLDIPFDFRHDASAGIHSLEFAFKLQGTSQRRFSLFSQVRLGHPELQLDWRVKAINDYSMQVQVDVTNSSNQPVSFDCKLFPRGHAYQTLQILDAPIGKSTHTRQLPIPRAAVTAQNPLWIRCEQLGTSVLLNYRITHP